MFIHPFLCSYVYFLPLMWVWFTGQQSKQTTISNSVHIIADTASILQMISRSTVSSWTRSWDIQTLPAGLKFVPDSQWAVQHFHAENNGLNVWSANFHCSCLTLGHKFPQLEVTHTHDMVEERWRASLTLWVCKNIFDPGASESK